MELHSPSGSDLSGGALYVLQINYMNLKELNIIYKAIYLEYFKASNIEYANEGRSLSLRTIE